MIRKNETKVTRLKFNKNNPENNSITITNFTTDFTINLALKITAVENADYSLYSQEK